MQTNRIGEANDRPIATRTRVRRAETTDGSEITRTSDDGRIATHTRVPRGDTTEDPDDETVRTETASQ